MDAIRTYTNTKCELEVAKARLSLLMDRKEQLYCKYFPVTQQLKTDIVSGGEKDKDKFASYMYELYNVDIGTGMSLADEIDYQRTVVDKLTYYVNVMSETLGKMTGIEYNLYYEIVIRGVRPSKAVSDIAERYSLEDRAVWKYHYSKIKKYITILKKDSESTVTCLV